MSESEEENFCFFGKPLDPYDEDAFPKKRPITVEEQIATDAQGRRRFHGAFTGGFSAGFFNTVGSLEGWTPSEFKSTRQEKARNVVQKPQDFMDQEDIGEYGIAPQTVRATDDFSTSKKRRKQVFSDGPIPGAPVLETLLTSGNETIGYLLLKNLGIQDKVHKQLEETGSSNMRVYGCQMPTQYKIPEKLENKQYVIPNIYKEFLEKAKANTFGLDYQGLDRAHINLFTKSNLVVRDKNNKKFSIGGQAFGVGAFEEEDDDIYMKEDMSNYDFEMRKEKDNKKKVQNHGDLLFGVFKHAQAPLISKKLYPPPTIPHSFSGKHKVKKSRFEPVVVVKEEVDRHRINPEVRARYLGEETQDTHTPSKPARNSPAPNTNTDGEGTSRNRSFDVSFLMTDRFVSASSKEEVSDITEPAKKSETTHGTADMREAARMKMFGPLTRVTTDWHPCACLCKRFNVPEPLMDRPEEKTRKRTKNLIFEQQKHTDEDTSLFKPGVSADSSTSQENQVEVEEIAETSSTNIPEQTVPIKIENIDTEQQQTDVKEEDDTAPKDITDRIGIADKTDLFKAVFLSSSESEDEEDKTNEDVETTDRTEEFKESLLSEQLLPKIKPLKDGILSNLNFHKFTLPREESVSLHEESTAQIATSSSDSKPEQSYGPQLPSQKIVVSDLKNTRTVSSDSEDDWVEKGGRDKKKKNKHKKKNKKKDKRAHEKKKKSHKSTH